MALLHWLFFSIQRWCRIFMFRYCINVGKQIISILSTAVQKNSSIAHSLLLVLIGGYFDNHPHSLWCPSFSVTIVQIEKRPIYGNPSARALIVNHRAFCIFSVHLFNDFIGLDFCTSIHKLYSQWIPAVEDPFAHRNRITACSSQLAGCRGHFHLRSPTGKRRPNMNNCTGLVNSW